MMISFSGLIDHAMQDRERACAIDGYALAREQHDVPRPVRQWCAGTTSHRLEQMEGVACDVSAQRRSALVAEIGTHVRKQEEVPANTLSLVDELGL
jgi:hypothetical protein